MRFRKNTWQISIFIKLVLIFFTVIIPLYAVSLVINNWGAENIRNNISRSILTHVSQYIDMLENEMDHVKTRQLEYLRDVNLQMLSVAANEINSYDKVKAVNDLHLKLQDICDSSIYIKSASVHLPFSEKSISSAKFFTPMPEEEYKATLKLAADKLGPLSYWKDRIYLSLYYPDPMLANRKMPMFLFNIELSPARIKEELARYSSYDGERFVLLSREINTVVANTGSDADTIQAGHLLERLEDTDSQNGTEIISIGKEEYLVAYSLSNYLDMALFAFVPVRQVMGPLRYFKMWFWVLSIISVAIILFFSFSIYKLIYRPLKKLKESFHKVEEGTLEIFIQHSGNDEFRYLYNHFNRMVHKMKQLISHAYEEHILVQRAQLKQLQSQINPHFLYNNMFLLNRMIKADDTDNAMLLSHYLGVYFQYVTRNAADELPLASEVKHARTYVEIQTMRFSNQILVEFEEVSAEFQGIIVPRLILQPIIENAYDYGMSKKDGCGCIYVRFSSSAQKLVITVEDNGKGMDDEKLANLQSLLGSTDEAAESTAILNIHRRLRLKFGEESGLGISRSVYGGLRVDIEIGLDRQ